MTESATIRSFKDALVIPEIRPYLPWPANIKKIVSGVNYNLPAKAEVRTDLTYQLGRFELAAAPILGSREKMDFLPGVSVMQRSELVHHVLLGFELTGLQHGFCLDNHTEIFPDNLPENAYFVLAGTVIYKDEGLSEPNQLPVAGEDHAVTYYSLDKDYDAKGKVVIAKVWRRKWFHLRLRFPRNGYFLCARRLD